jgi:hypothetical protein
MILDLVSVHATESDSTSNNIQLQHGPCEAAGDREDGKQCHGAQDQQFCAEYVAEFGIDDEET